MNLFKGDHLGYFHPKDGLKRYEALAVLIRLFNGTGYDESQYPRRQKYYEKGYDIGITKERNQDALNRSLTRYEMALFLYRFKLKYEILNTLQVRDEGVLFAYLDGSTTTDIEGNMQAKILIDNSILFDTSVDNIMVDIFGDQYKILKTKTDTHFGKDYSTRYGELYDENENFVGVVGFHITNGFFSNGNIRPFLEVGKENTYYHIQASEQQPYYRLQEVTLPSISTNGTGATNP